MIKIQNKLIGILIFTILIISNVVTVNSTYLKKNSDIDYEIQEKTHLSFAAFSDTHIGIKYEYPYYIIANHLDKIGNDLVENTNLLDFSIHLGDIINHNTAQINGVGLPFYVNQYKNNLKAYLISNINIPFHCVLGNHDLIDYQKNCNNPFNLTLSLIDELSLNNPIYAMMRDGILFLVVPELGYVQWTHPVIYEWIEFMTKQYRNKTTIILCHQAIEDTTYEDANQTYRGKQDMDFWANLFQKNPQIKMWINGHNHVADWYVSNQSTGNSSLPIYKFGHEMAFSAPYSQMDWGFYHEEDRIVIYNISSAKITTSTWENNGFGGRWVSDYMNSWNVNTTFNSEAQDWYSFPMFLQDNETQLTDMKLLSPDITLQLTGTKPMELFYDSKMESPSSKPKVQEIILGFGNDRCGNVIWSNPGMKVYGSTLVTFPEKSPYSKRKIQEDGRTGQPYQSFAMGTICAAVPGQTYNFTITARSKSGNGRFDLIVNCTDWGTRSQYSVLSDSESRVISHTFGTDYETVYGSYTVPNNENAWFLQGGLNFVDPTEYDVSLFSVKRERTSDTTDNFHLCLSGTWYNISGTLVENQIINFSADPRFLSNVDGVMNFTAFIDGNHNGFVNLIYHEPLLLSRNARFRVNHINDGIFNLSLTKTISRNSPVDMVVWNSKIFNIFPFVTEKISRLILSGITGRIFKSIFKDESLIFKMIPLSTDSLYNNINITADDNSGKKHIGSNGNIWLTCKCPDENERFVEITLFDI
ncbi:MAG: metallophosphoesterase [Thermoplasmatales archaeon]|nr:MAG: metallophosphoesterase [Thermoplasmatales archaeon]